MRDKFILDATAGFRMMWSNKHHPNTIYLDQREKCKPDIVGDFTDLSQFRDETFRLVVFDPPHRTMVGVPKDFWANRDYGALVPETWQSDLKKAFSELWRVLKPYGILIFKWSDDHIKLNRIEQYFPSSPLFHQITNAGKYAKTYWFCFMKIPEKET